MLSGMSAKINQGVRSQIYGPMPKKTNTNTIEHYEEPKNSSIIQG